MIDYRETTAGVTPEMLRGFFSEWRKPQTPEGHLEILGGSDYIVLAVDGDAGKVVGFITALTDGVQASFIPLLEVLPDYRGRGYRLNARAKDVGEARGASGDRLDL